MKNTQDKTTMSIQTRIATGKFAMLAHKNGDRPLDFENHTYFIQPKLDGIRCIITKDGAFSRNGKPFYNVKHILNELAPLFKYAPELILDGELYSHAYRDKFSKIISLMRKQTPTNEDRFNAVDVQFHNYDIVDTTREGMTYTERLELMQHLQRKYNFKYVRAISSPKIDNQFDLDLLHKINKAHGYEGSMVRSNMPYEHTRSWSLQKVKDWQDTEFTITDYIEGKGKFSGGLGKWLGFDDEGRDIEVPWPNITIKKRQEIFNNIGEWIGKRATFQYFERTENGAYRFPRFLRLREEE